MKAHELQETIDQLAARIETTLQQHESNINQLKEANQQRIDQFQENHLQQSKKQTVRLQEEIHLRKSLAELQATNHTFQSLFIKNLIEWENYYLGLRKHLAEKGTLEQPSPLTMP